MDRPAPAYEGDQEYVFVSYSHADQEMVYPEIRWLQDQGVNVWYDEGISGASRWRDAIAGKIAGCNLFLIYLSASSADSRVCREELEYALDQDRQILGIFLESTQLPDGIRLAISNRQALMRFELTPDDYRRKFWSAVTGQLEMDQVSPAGDMPVVTHVRRIRLLSAAIAVAVSAGLGAIGTSLLEDDARSVPESYRFDIVTSDPVVRFVENDIGAPLSAFTLTNSGAHLIYVGEKDGARHLYRRDMRTGEVDRLLGTENAAFPVVSPDDAWVAFFDADTLYKVPAGGGRRVRLAEIRSMDSLSWSVIDRLAVLHRDSLEQTVVRADGGVIDELSGRIGGYGWYGYALLDATRALVVDEDAHLNVADLTNGELRSLGLQSIAFVLRGDHLFYTTSTGIAAVRFDRQLGHLTSPVVTFDVPTRILYGAPAWSIADNGLMVYAPSVGTSSNPLIWGNADGEAQPLPYDPEDFGTFSISPDNRFIAATRFSVDGLGVTVWLYDVEEAYARPVSVESFNFIGMLEWLPDSSGFFFSSGEEDGVLFHQIGTASFSDVSADFPGAVSGIARNGSLMVLSADQKIVLWDRITGETRLVTDETDAWGAQVSPDGTGVAYVSSLTGSFQVIYSPVDSPDKVVQVSRRPGSEEPRWNRDGSRLYYRSGNRIMVVDRQDPAGTFGRPRVFFEGNFINVPWRSYDIRSDESAALLIARTEAPTATVLNVTTDWIAQVERAIQAAEARAE